MARITDLHKKWMNEPKYRKAYAALEEEFAFASAVIAARNRAGLTQQALADLIASSQSRVAKMEAGASDISLDLICRALFSLGMSRQVLGRLIASKRAA